jgi:hypothetical protein
VSRFRRALAATTTLAAVAAASALLTSAAGAAPARAATMAAATAPAGGHTIEVTAHPDTQRPGGAGTQNCPLPNSTPASHITPATCTPPLPDITCWIYASPVDLGHDPRTITASAAVDCNHPITRIYLTEFISDGTLSPDGVPIALASASDNKQPDATAASTVLTANCRPDTIYTNAARATVYWPPGYGASRSVLHMEASLVTLDYECR